MLRSRLKSRSRQELPPRRRSIYDTLSGRDLVTRCSPPIVSARFRDADHARQLGENWSFSSLGGSEIHGGSECLLELGPVGLAAGLGHLPDEIGDRRSKCELGTVGVLKPELVVMDDPGAVKHAAGHPRARSEGSVDVNDRRGAI